jgi:hypothetical protein
MRDLFSRETLEAGDAAYRRLETRARMEKIGAIAVLLAMIGVVVMLVKRIRSSRRVRPASR